MQGSQKEMIVRKFFCELVCTIPMIPRTVTCLCDGYDQDKTYIRVFPCEDSYTMEYKKSMKKEFNQFKCSLCYLCLCCTVPASLPHTQEAVGLGYHLLQFLF